MARERWRLIDSWPAYQVSDRGRIRRISTGRILRPDRGRRGVLRIMLYKAGRRSPKIMVHHLVAFAFVGPPPGPIGRGKDEYQINHLDASPPNNRWSNIEWVTPAENHAHAVRAGLHPRGERHALAVLTRRRVRAIRRRLGLGERQRDIARRFGISSPTVSDIHNGRTWRHVA